MIPFYENALLFDTNYQTRYLSCDYPFDLQYKYTNRIGGGCNMKGSKRKFFAGFLTLMMILLALSGCGSNAADKSDSGKVQLRFAWWGGEDRHDATLKAIKRYMELNPNVEIKGEYGGFDGYNQKLSTQIAGGTAPDIMQMDYYYMAEYAMKGDAFVNLDDYEELLSLSEFSDEFLQDFSVVDGKLTGLPTGVNAVMLFADKNLLSQNNIDLTGKYDWDKLIEEGEKVNKNNPDQYFFNMGPSEMADLVSTYMKQKTGNNLINDDYTLGFEKADLVDGFTYVQELWDKKVAPKVSDYSTIVHKIQEAPKWINGNLAAVMMSASAIETFKTSKNDLTALLLPISDDAVDTAIRTQPSQVFSVSKKSKNPEEAVKFMNWFLTDEEAIEILGSVRGAQPTEKGRNLLAESDQLDPLIAEGVDLGLEYSGKPVNSISINTEIDNEFTDTIEQLGYGKLSAEEAADHLIAQINKVIEDVKP